jgi:hypothetical protein
MPTIPGSFPVGTISADSLATGTATGGLGSTIGQQVGEYYPTTGLPAYPSFIKSCNDAVCYILANGVLKDARIQITVDADPLSKIYGSSDPSLTYQVVSGNLGSANFTGTLNRKAGENVGSYVIGEGSLSLPGLYHINFVDSSLTIKPATLTETATATSRLYGSANPTFSGSISGFVNGDTLDSATTGTLVFGTSATSASNVGSYAINGSGLSAANYVIVQASGNASALTIAPASLTIQADDKSRTAGQGNPALTATISGLVNGDGTGVVSGLDLTTSATTSSAAGTFPIVPNGASASNYVIQYVNGVLTVTPQSTSTPPIQNPIQTVALTSGSTSEVVNTQPLNQPPGPPGPPHAGNGPPPAPGGLPPQFGARFFTPPPLGETHFVQNEVVLQIPSNIPYSRVQSVMSLLGLTILGTQDLGLIGVTCYRVHIDNGASITSVVERLKTYQIVAGAQANYTYMVTQGQTLAQGQDPDLASLSQGEGDAAQYTISKLGLIDIHRRFKGGNISVAVIDSQIDVKHPDLDGVVAEQFDAVGAADMPHSHGTGMAGAIFAHRKLMGIAPSARLYAIHAFSSGAASAESTTFNILKGLEWASAKGVRVINMSFAGPRDPSMERALKAAHDKGIVLIAAAGNAGPKSPPLYPAADPNVIAVTATDVNDKIFTGANRGRYIAVAAPGVDILVPAPDNTYQLTTGTSVASAEVSGLVALLLERNPNLGPEDVRMILTSSARRLSSKDRDDDFGSGLVDPSKAIQTAGDLKSVDMTASVPAQPPAPRPPVPARPAVLPVSHPGGSVLRPPPTR